MSIREDLKAWIDGELPPERAEEVRAAVDSDPALQQEIQFMKMLSSEISGAAAQAEVKGAEKVLEKVKGRRRFNPMLVWPVTAVLAIIVVGGALDLSKRRDGGAPAGVGGGFDADVAASSEPARGGVSLGFETKPEEKATGGGRMPADSQLNAPVTSPAPNPSSATTSLLPREVIRVANLGVRVPKVEEAQEQAHTIVTGFGGFVESSSVSGAEGESPMANSTLRVPSGMFDSAVSRILALGSTIHKNVSGQDVTTQVADISARLKVMRAEEDSYITMLRAAKRVGELLEIKERLSRVRQEIESLDAQRTALKGMAALSTIQVEFHAKAKIGEPKPADDWTESTWTSAVNSLKEVGRFLGQGVIFLFVMAPVWIPVGLVFWWLARKARRP